MERAFADARDAVFAVDAAWTKLLPSVVQSGRELDALRDRASRTGVALDPEFTAVAGTLDGLRRQVDRDPLGALKASTTDLEPHLDRLRAQINAVEQTRTSVTADLARAATLLEGQTVANAAAHDARLRSLEEICDPVGLQAPLTDGQIEGLRPWLATLRTTVEQGNWRAARVGLDRWLATANEYQITAENARPIAWHWTSATSSLAYSALAAPRPPILRDVACISLLRQRKLPGVRKHSCASFRVAWTRQRPALRSSTPRSARSRNPRVSTNDRVAARR
jgi:hypothetical protein